MTAATTTATTALANATTLRDDLVDEGSTWSVERVERQVANVRAELDTAISALREEHGVDAFDAVDALLQVAETLLDLAIEVNSGRARLVDWTMPHSGSAALAAYWLYGDVDRRHEMVDLNHIPDPNRITMGTVLKVYAA